MQKVMIFFLVFSTLMVFSSCQQQEQSQAKLEITELEEMHHFIHPMWHDAYPNKDSEQLKALYPDLEQQFKKLQDATFPEEWEDKKMHWQGGVKQMEKTLGEYKSALDQNDKEGLLTAAKKLHDNFESLMMIVNPPIPELDNFHKTLYHVYHDYLPNQDWQKLKAAMPEFEEKARALKEAKLPRWMADQEETFKSACDQLEMAVKNLSSLKDSKDHGALSAAVEAVHEAYVDLRGCVE
jgi:hypothetical protein